jgi:hypothetical protein
VSTACYNLLSISHVNYYQTRLSRVQTSGVRGPPWTSAGWTARPSSRSWQPQPVDGLDDRPSNCGAEWPSTSSRPLLQSGGDHPPRPSGQGRPPCPTTTLNIKKCNHILYNFRIPGSGARFLRVATQDRVFLYYVPNSSIKHSKSDSKDRSQEIL